MAIETNTAWETFIDETLAVAQELDCRALPLNAALARIRGAASGVAPEIQEFVLNTFSEIDGFPDDYEETIRLFQSRPSQREIEIFMEKS